MNRLIRALIVSMGLLLSGSFGYGEGVNGDAPKSFRDLARESDLTHWWLGIYYKSTPAPAAIDRDLIVTYFADIASYAIVMQEALPSLASSARTTSLPVDLNAYGQGWSETLLRQIRNSTLAIERAAASGLLSEDLRNQVVTLVFSIPMNPEFNKTFSLSADTQKNIRGVISSSAQPGGASWIQSKPKVVTVATTAMAAPFLLQHLIAALAKHAGYDLSWLEQSNLIDDLLAGALAAGTILGLPIWHLNKLKNIRQCVQMWEREAQQRDGALRPLTPRSS